MGCKRRNRGPAFLLLGIGAALFIALMCSPTVLVVIAGIALIAVGIMLLTC